MAVAFFTNEEGSRFQPDMFGSLVYTGAPAIGARAGHRRHRWRGRRRRIVRASATPALPRSASREVHAYVELHIEQGPVLEAEGFRIGAVEGVQGISWTEFTLTGQSNHAGTTPMRLRHDAGYVAAEITAFVRRLAQELGGNQVATVGALTLSPNLVNVVARSAP